MAPRAGGWKAWLCATPGLVALCAAPAHAQLSAFDWTLQGSSSGSGAVVGDTLHVVGPNQAGFGCDFGPATWLQSVAPSDATVIVDVDFTNLDSGGCHFDAPAWVIDGVVFPVPEPSNCWLNLTYHIEFEVAAGQSFGLGVWSADCAEGPGVADFHDFLFVTGGISALGHALDPRISLTVQGEAAGGLLGTAVADAGDVDGDGVPDLVVGAPAEGPSGTARVLSGADGSVLHLLSGGTPGAQFGLAVSGAGDLDGDGVPDIAVGAPFDDTPSASSGSVRAYSGATGALLFERGGTAFAGFLGYTITPVGDFDGDGFTDVAVGQPTNANGKAGRVFVLGGPDGHTILEKPLGGADAKAGRAIALLDDLDGGGRRELAVGAPFGLQVGQVSESLSTLVLIVSGETGAVLQTFTAPGMFGFALAVVRDEDGDGLRDLAVGSPSWNPGGGAGRLGRVQILSTADGTELGMHVGSVPDAHFGAALAGGIDFDGDSSFDLAVGAPLEPAPGATGVVRLLELPGLQLSQQLVTEAEGLGAALARGADADGDGLLELLVGAPQGAEGAGRAHVVSALELPGAPVLQLTGTLQPGSALQVQLTGLPPLGAGWLVVGGSNLSAPFKGGTLVPHPGLLVPLVAPVSGELVLAATWPVLPVPWTTLWMQAWWPSGAGPAGWIASQALQLTGNP